MLSITSFSFSQTSEKPIEYASATISASYCVVLDNTSEIKEFYAADASALGWTSEADAIKKCGFYTNNLVTYQADYANGKILVHIHTDRTYEPENIIWWNEYLQSICK